MPAQVLPTVENFEAFVASLTSRGFLEIGAFEMGQQRFRAPVRRRGREAGFIFTANDLSVIVWTTFLRKEGCAREVDAGWVLICKGNRAQYFAHPFNRTKHFLDRLLWYARISRKRVLARPHCPVCHEFMEIARREDAFKARFWKCSKGHTPHYHSWDHGLPQEALAFLKKERKRRARYRQKLKEEGREYGAAMRHRDRWKVVHLEQF